MSAPPLDLCSIPNLLDTAGRTCRAVVETPARNRAKFTFDRDTGLFALSGILPAGLAFPVAFGFVPSTKGEDGDALDILIVSEQDLPIGCLVSARLLGVIEAEQTEQDGTVARNDRLIARIAESRAFAEVEEIDQLGASFTDEIEQFFVSYNQLKGKKFHVTGRGNSARAIDLVQNGIGKAR